ncbi:vacuolar protein sorting-associated protein 72 [Geosmithia morbida]|uniref:Vacuolar protein sorting-associated protein 72 n=1 Tax=Geosmithia morbida TaxID=1094350 RepID=A0A9P4YSQ0_9HYPO|nr:vacuolar protein sorting-associated protein 72 [Geosmithia morbida]KAF4120299.1 vacuolar protein sorting-associated protein 72 [Geosmithia morbida]
MRPAMSADGTDTPKDTDEGVTTPAINSRQSSPSLSDASDSSNSDSEQPPAKKIEWLVTGRGKRSTAGNRMKSMLANEEPDSDLELLFAEEDDDQGFTDVGDDASDVHMDSSSDDEDDGADVGGDEDLEGEKELERQAKEKKAAQRKRKAQDAIPAKFRKKKVRIARPESSAATTPTSATTPVPPAGTAAPAPRLKKKSERASWLPTAADMPTRASSRQTTRLSKEQLHAQMEEREARRLKQLEHMQRKAERRESLKKPPMTQEDRLREAQIVEHRNSKSLNRWEEAEKQREEERRAKLAALQERTLKGPVITFWSGTRAWKDGGVAKYVVVEEKPKRKEKKPKKSKGEDGKPDEARTDEEQATGDSAGKENAPTSTTSTTTMEKPAASAPSDPATGPPAPSVLASPEGVDTKRTGSSADLPTPGPDSSSEGAAATTLPSQDVAKTETTSQKEVQSRSTVDAEEKPADQSQMAEASKELQSESATQKEQPPQPESTAEDKDKEQRPQEESPVDEKRSQPESATTQDQPQPETVQADKPRQEVRAEQDAAAEDAEPRTTATRRTIIYQNFDENAIRDKTVQTQILFGRKMTKLSTRYRDPKTGLPFHNALAYKEIRRLTGGVYRWSRTIGAWGGSADAAAKGHPPRFLAPADPEEEGRKKVRQRQVQHVKDVKDNDNHKDKDPVEHEEKEGLDGKDKGEKAEEEDKGKLHTQIRVQEVRNVPDADEMQVDQRSNTSSVSMPKVKT